MPSLIHHVSAAITSSTEYESESYLEACRKVERLRAYAQKLGFDVMSEAADVED